MQQQRNFRQMNEGFDYVVAAESPEDMVVRLKEWASKSQLLVPIVRMGVGAEANDWNIPEGSPETLKIEDDIPDGMADTTITQEWRRVRQFVDPKSNIHNLPAWKREAQWVNLLEGVHYKEAAILTAVKDGTLLDLYPQLEQILEGIGITEYNKPSKAQ